MIRSSLLLLSTLLAGLHAGFFFAWSFSVMTGLDAASPDAAITTMQSMNANVRNAAFGTVFFGAPAIALLTAATMLVIRRGLPAMLTLLGFLSLAASVAITVSVHVPLNEALAALPVPVDTDAAARAWRDYADPWVQWNHLRMLTSLAGCLFLALGFRMDRRG